MELEEYLKTLGSEIRIEILKYLQLKATSVNFSDIEFYLDHKFAKNNVQINLDFHLKKLISAALIVKDTHKHYAINQFGKESIYYMEKVKEVIFSKSSIKIRTSDYTIEDFNEQKIIDNLIREAFIPQETAESIAHELKTKIIESKLNYLTAPLIREMINTILIERNMIESRHKLTRLGLPPYDIKEMLESKKIHNPQEFNVTLGTNILEQYSLLNILRNKYSDMILSGKLTITDIEHFSLTPIEIILSGEKLLTILESDELLHEFDYLFLQEDNLRVNSSVTRDPFTLDIDKFIMLLNHYFTLLKPFFPSGISIIRFETFLSKFLDSYNENDLEDLFILCLNKINRLWPIKLHISTISNIIYLNPLMEVYSLSVKSDFKTSDAWNAFPLLQIHLTKEARSEILRIKDINKLKNTYKLITQLIYSKHIILDMYNERGKPEVESMYSNEMVPIKFSSYSEIDTSILIEKISINLLLLYLRSDRNMGEFYKLLEDSIHDTFHFFETKYNLITKNISNFKDWSKVSQIFFTNPDSTPSDTSSQIFDTSNSLDSYKYSTKIFCSISFYGLEELIYLHTHLFIHENEKNRKLTTIIIDFMVKLLNKQNKLLPEQIKYILSEPSKHKSINSPKNTILRAFHKELKNNKQENCIKNKYSLGFICLDKKKDIDLWTKIYEDLSQSKYKDYILTYPMEEENEENLQKKFEFLQKLLNIKCCGLKRC